MRPALIIAALIVTGCTQFPELDSATSHASEAADYPALINIDPIVAETRAGPAPEDTTRALQTRAAALKSRADQLRRSQPVDPATRARMRGGVT